MNGSLTLKSCTIGALGAAERAAIIQLCEAAFAEDLADLFAFAPTTVCHIRASVEGRLLGHACW